MTTTDLVIDGDLIDEHRALAVRPAVTLVPQTTAQDLIARLAVIRQAMEQAMQKDVDYGVIPGTGKKPTLLKPGAEKLAVLFQMDVQIENEKLWGDDGHLTVISRATVYHIPSGSRIASGEGMCSTREGKYAFRHSERFCPKCGVAAIIKGKAEYGGGWVCFKKKGGCGLKYGETEKAILDQPVGQVPNPNIADTYNTVDKMASKRARVDAILAATGASALFTQDVEDLPPPQDSSDGRADSQSAERGHARLHADGVSDDQAPGYKARLPEPPPLDDGTFPPPDDVIQESATAAQKKKLNVLVGTLRDAGHVTTEQLWRGCNLNPELGRGDDGEVHWSPLRDGLTREQASQLIERLTVLEETVAAQAAAKPRFEVPESARQ